ncbi:MAG: hypothetical protein H6765_07425 [Candidatus Peribacteria bacterium]|nr:MAG: hypothetical protein H6765_07425 [Candidatus Peribacteria bacterium]
MRNTQVKALICAGIACVTSVFGFVQASFANTYFCTIEGNSITVSIETGTDYCFGYVANVHQSLQAINQDIAKASEHIKQREDVRYWSSVQYELELKQASLLDLQAKLIAAIDDYEFDLFLRVKTILAVYLRDDKALLEYQYAQRQ